jgi:hypothetical protein
MALLRLNVALAAGWAVIEDRKKYWQIAAVQPLAELFIGSERSSPRIAHLQGK